jgi:hypothetical protein
VPVDDAKPHTLSDKEFDEETKTFEKLGSRDYPRGKKEERYNAGGDDQLNALPFSVTTIDHHNYCDNEPVVVRLVPDKGRITSPNQSVKVYFEGVSDTLNDASDCTYRGGKARRKIIGCYVSGQFVEAAFVDRTHAMCKMPVEMSAKKVEVFLAFEYTYLNPFYDDEANGNQGNNPEYTAYHGYNELKEGKFGEVETSISEFKEEASGAYRSVAKGGLGLRFIYYEVETLKRVFTDANKLLFDVKTNHFSMSQDVSVMFDDVASERVRWMDNRTIEVTLPDNVNPVYPNGGNYNVPMPVTAVSVHGEEEFTFSGEAQKLNTYNAYIANNGSYISLYEALDKHARNARMLAKGSKASEYFGRNENYDPLVAEAKHQFHALLMNATIELEYIPVVYDGRSYTLGFNHTSECGAKKATAGQRCGVVSAKEDDSLSLSERYSVDANDTAGTGYKIHDANATWGPTFSKRFRPEAINKTDLHKEGIDYSRFHSLEFMNLKLLDHGIADSDPHKTLSFYDSSLFQLIDVTDSSHKDGYIVGGPGTVIEVGIFHQKTLSWICVDDYSAQITQRTNFELHCKYRLHIVQPNNNSPQSLRFAADYKAWRIEQLRKHVGKAEKTARKLSPG